MKAAALLFALALAPAASAQAPAASATGAERTHVCSTLVYLKPDSPMATLKAQPNNASEGVARVLDGRQMFCLVYRPEGGDDWNYVVALAPESDYHPSMWCAYNEMDGQHPLCNTPVLPVLLLPAQQNDAVCRIREGGNSDGNLELHVQGRCAEGWIPVSQLQFLAG